MAVTNVMPTLLARSVNILNFTPSARSGDWFGIPRPAIHLVKIDNAIRCVGVKDPELDVTDRLRDVADQQKLAMPGYVVIF